MVPIEATQFAFRLPRRLPNIFAPEEHWYGVAVNSGPYLAGMIAALPHLVGRSTLNRGDGCAVRQGLACRAGFQSSHSLAGWTPALLAQHGLVGCYPSCLGCI